MLTRIVNTRVSPQTAHRLDNHCTFVEKDFVNSFFQKEERIIDLFVNSKTQSIKFCVCGACVLFFLHLHLP